jgi:methylmalonyl-CoA mutase cobalamin-binding subunit
VSGTPSIVQFGGTGLDVIHPGTTRAVTTVAGLFGDDDSSVAAVSIPYELGAEGVALISDTWSIAKTEVLKLLAENA